MLQYITNTSVSVPIADQVRQVIAGGCRWVQIRMKDASDDEITNIVKEIKPLCKETETFLIINDRVELAKELEVDGVHLGNDDMSPSQARAILGAEAIIGVTVNSFTDIERFRYLDIDYFGIGPFKFTETKKNLAPVIGLQGYSEIATKIKAEKIDIPTVAVGGISFDDVDSIMAAGINGIAVSYAIANSENITEETEKFINLLTKQTIEK